MRIKRTDKNFTVRQKADRKIHYAGQGKKYTENTANFSPKEKQDALRQKNLSGAGTGIQSKTQIQRQSNAGRNAGDFLADDTAKSCQQEHGNSAGGSNGSKCGDLSVFGNLHVKRPLRKYRKESVLNQEQPAGNRKPEQQQYQNQGQQVQRPSAYHENIIKTKEPVLHRKEDIPSSIKRADGFILKERKGKKEEAQKPKSAATSKARREKASGNFSTDDKAGNLSASGYAQPFPDRRDGQISKYKRKKFFRSGKEKYSRPIAGRENAGVETDTAKSAGTPKIPEIYRMETQPLQMQGEGRSALLQKRDDLPVGNTSTSHIQKRNTGDSIRQRDGDIPGRKDKTGRKDKKNKKDKGKDKDAKKDKSRSSSKKRKDRAAVSRLLSYASDKFSQEEQKDSLLKVARDLLAGKAKAAVTGKLLSIGASLLPALIPAFIIVLIITLLFNSPFSILLPKLSEEPGAVEVLAEYTEEFREKVQETLLSRMFPEKATALKAGMRMKH